MRGAADVFEGTVTSVREDAVAITLLDGSSFTFTYSQLERAEVRASRPNGLRGGIVGGGLGLAVGVILLVTDDRAGRQFGESFDPWKIVAPPVGGAVLGIAVGRLIRTPRWAPAFIPLPDASPGDFALSWSVHVGE